MKAITETLTIDAFIRATLIGYDFSKEKEERTVQLFNWRVRSLGIYDTRQIYKYIVNTLDRWRLPFTERKLLSLDAVVDFKKNEEGQPFHEFIDVPLESIKDEESTICLSEAVELVRGGLDEQNYRILRELTQRHGGDFRIRLDSTKPLSDTIDRLHRVAEIFYNNGMVTIPRKHIVVLSVNPFNVQVGNLDGETVKKIYQGPKLGLNSYQTAEYAGVDRSTVFHYWKTAGVHSPLVHEYKKEESEIMELPGQFRGNASKASRHSKYDRNTIMKYWRRNGLNCLGREDRLSYQQIAEILDLNSKYNGNVKEATKHSQYDWMTIANYWDKHGLGRKKLRRRCH